MRRLFNPRILQFIKRTPVTRINHVVFKPEFMFRIPVRKYTIDPSKDPLLQKPNVKKACDAFQYGSKLVEEKKYIEGQKYFEEALPLLQEELPPNHWLLALAYNNIAESLRMLEKTSPKDSVSFENFKFTFEDIPSLYDKSYNIWLETADTNEMGWTMEMGMLMNNYGTYYLENKQNVEKALEKFKLSDKYRSEHLERVKNSEVKGHAALSRFLLAITKNNVGLAFANCAKHDRALRYYFDAKELLEQSVGEKHPAWVTSTHGLAVCYYVLRNFEQTIQLCKKIIEVSRGNAELEPEAGKAHGTLANALYALENKESALEHYEKSYEMCTKYLDKDDPSIGMAAINLAICLQSLQVPDRTRIKNLIEEAVRIKKVNEERGIHVDYFPKLPNEK